MAISSVWVRSGRCGPPAVHEQPVQSRGPDGPTSEDRCAREIALLLACGLRPSTEQMLVLGAGKATIFAGPGLPALVIGDHELAVRVADEAGLLQLLGCQGHAGPLHTRHQCQELVAEQEAVTYADHGPWSQPRLRTPAWIRAELPIDRLLWVPGPLARSSV